MRPVYIKWLDHWSADAGWTDLDDIPEEGVVCESVGYLVDEYRSVLRHLNHTRAAPASAHPGSHSQALRDRVQRGSPEADRQPG